MLGLLTLTISLWDLDAWNLALSAVCMCGCIFYPWLYWSFFALSITLNYNLAKNYLWKLEKCHMVFSFNVFISVTEQEMQNGQRQETNSCEFPSHAQNWSCLSLIISRDSKGDITAALFMLPPLVLEFSIGCGRWAAPHSTFWTRYFSSTEQQVLLSLSKSNGQT